MSLTTLSQDLRNPLNQPLPTNANPTDILAARFASWRAIIKGVIAYLKDVIMVHEESVLSQIRLQHSIMNNFPLANDSSANFPAGLTPNAAGGNTSSSAGGGNTASSSNTTEEINNIKKFFLPFGNGSIIDVPNALNEYHKTVGGFTSRTAKELANNVIPRLEDLRRDLSIKIKEIKNLSSDFKTTVSKEVAQTKTELSAFYNSIDQIKSVGTSNLLPKQDPFLTKIYLDKQIKKQLIEENYLHEAFLNIQSSGKELEKLVVMEIQNALKIYARLIGEESQVVFNVLIPKLDNGFVSRPPEWEWDSFIKQNPNSFINTNTKPRRFIDISYKYINDPLTLEIRSSFLERRSKFLKSYSRGWYVLTPTFIHEFKSSDRKKDVFPVMSLSLDDCQVAEHSKKDVSNPNTWHKFVLHTKQNGIIHRGHNWVFRAETYDLMIAWYNDIKKLTQLPTPEARAHYIAEKLQLQKQKSRRSLQIHSSSNISLVNSINRDGNNQSRNRNVSKRLSAPVGSFSQPTQQPQPQPPQIKYGSFQLQNTQELGHQQLPQQSHNVITKDGIIITPVESINENQHTFYQPANSVSQQQLAAATQHQRAFSLQNQQYAQQQYNQQQQPQQQLQQQQHYYPTGSQANLHRSVSLAETPNSSTLVPVSTNDVPLVNNINNNNNSQVYLNRSFSMQGYQHPNPAQTYDPQQQQLQQSPKGQYIMSTYIDNQHPQQQQQQQKQQQHGQIAPNIIVNDSGQPQPQQPVQYNSADQGTFNSNNNPEFPPIATSISGATFTSSNQPLPQAPQSQPLPQAPQSQPLPQQSQPLQRSSTQYGNNSILQIPKTVR